MMNRRLGRVKEFILKTGCGAVKGFRRDGAEDVLEFRSIPYAMPPVGELRWKPPVPMEKWEGIKDCTKYGPIPMQYLDGAYVEPYQSDFYYDGVPPMGEDCLYLNITVSEETLKGASKRPVFVWFHGGGLSTCYTFEPEADGEAFARKGIVVVSVEQRLGIFGYFALPQLTKEQGHSGNYGLMDQIAALSWIEKNISAFGGDPGQITVGGQSGGTTKAVTQTISPKNTVPVKRLILQSGFNWDKEYPTQEQAEQYGLERLHDLGLDQDSTLDELRSLPASRFILAKDPKNYRYGVNQDGMYVTDHSAREALKAGKMKQISILAGTNLGEADYPRAKNKEEFYQSHRQLLGEFYEKYDFENLVKADDYNADAVSRTLASWGLGQGDGRNLMLVRVYGRMAVERFKDGADTYAYLFTHMTPQRIKDVGSERASVVQWSWHSGELWYTFNSIKEGRPKVRRWTDWDYQLAESVNSYWANFIKTGDPNQSGLPYWPKAGKEMGYLVLGDGIYGVEGKESVLEDLMEDFVIKHFDF